MAVNAPAVNKDLLQFEMIKSRPDSSRKNRKVTRRTVIIINPTWLRCGRLRIFSKRNEILELSINPEIKDSRALKRRMIKVNISIEMTMLFNPFFLGTLIQEAEFLKARNAICSPSTELIKKSPNDGSKSEDAKKAGLNICI